MSDPLNDPRFPDRPQTQDFWRLSEVVLYLDGALEDTTFEEILGKIVDLDSLSYMAQDRAARFFERLKASFAEVDAAPLAAAFMNGFAAGVLFEQRGGHRDG